MPTTNDDAVPHQPPGWALEQAIDELPAEPDRETIERRAWDLVREAQTRAEEQHDEYDDPDRGGEG